MSNFCQSINAKKAESALNTSATMRAHCVGRADVERQRADERNKDERSDQANHA